MAHYTRFVPFDLTVCSPTWKLELKAPLISSTFVLLTPWRVWDHFRGLGYPPDTSWNQFPLEKKPCL